MKIDEEENIYDVAKILDFKINDRRKNSVTKDKEYLLYKIKWTNYKNNKNEITWKNFTSTIDCANLIIDFHHFKSERSESYRSFKKLAEWVSLLITLIFDDRTETQKSI